LFKLLRWLLSAFSGCELNLTIIVLFIFERVAFIAAALMLFRAVMPADVAPWPLT
jgi:hypothetical protein